MAAAHLGLKRTLGQSSFSSKGIGAAALRAAPLDVSETSSVNGAFGAVKEWGEFPSAEYYAIRRGDVRPLLDAFGGPDGWPEFRTRLWNSWALRPAKLLRGPTVG